VVGVLPINKPAVIACDKRGAFAQGSESDEAIHPSLRGRMDCFASLAMTVVARFAVPRNAALTMRIAIATKRFKCCDFVV